jgi:hypothetical protein
MPEIIDEQYGIVYEEPVLSSMTPSELLATFPEAVPIIKKKLREYENYLKDVEPLYGQILDILWQEIYANDSITKEEKERRVTESRRILYERPMGAIKKQINRLSHLLKTYEWRNQPVGSGTITDDDVQKAKLFPLATLVRPNHAGFIHCPFHDEKTASCKIFKDNHFHCFGCGAKGDVIDFVQKIDKIDFIAAVRKILGHA